MLPQVPFSQRPEPSSGERWWNVTFRQWAQTYLEERGMFPDQASAVVKATEDDPASEAMRGRWTDDTEGYPTPLLAVMAMAINHAAVTWIDANCPQAWYRPMFAEKAEA